MIVQLIENNPNFRVPLNTEFVFNDNTQMFEASEVNEEVSQNVTSRTSNYMAFNPLVYFNNQKSFITKNENNEQLRYPETGILRDAEKKPATNEEINNIDEQLMPEGTGPGCNYSESDTETSYTEALEKELEAALEDLWYFTDQGRSGKDEEASQSIQDYINLLKQQYNG